jgi:predicted AlkP superfamily pyrophosphatase or phosphodiesterase
MIGDKFYDLANKRLLLLSASKYDTNSKYWNKSEPFWLRQESERLKVGANFWPGSEVIDREPDLFLNYDPTYTLDERADHIVNWFTKFGLDIGLMSLNEPFKTGLVYGPDSVEYMRKVEELDEQLGSLLYKLQETGLLDSINIVVVSDSGMARFKDTVLFKDLLSESLINFSQTSYDVVSNVRPSTNVKVVFANPFF